MTSGYHALTDKEKATLRLLVRGHDAKSSARELGLSVHTINERLRDARRRLGVTSSREAARQLLAEEGTPYENHADESLGEEPAAQSPHQHGPRLTRALLTGGIVMSVLLAALLVPASPLSLLPAQSTGSTEAAAEPAAATPAGTAEQFLVLLDEGRWADSYAMTNAEFRRLNTLAAWTQASQRARPPQGAVLTRDMIADEFVPAPPTGYQLVKLRTRYASGADQVETLSLVREDGAWKIAGIVVG